MIAQSEKASKQSGIPIIIKKIYKQCGGDGGVPSALIKKKFTKDGSVLLLEFVNNSGGKVDKPLA